MADIAVVSPTRSGATITPAAAAAGGDAFLNNGSTYFVVDNSAGASPCTPAFASQVLAADAHPGEAPSDAGGAVAAGNIGVFGPFPPSAFNDANSKVQVSYDQVASVNVYAVSSST